MNKVPPLLLILFAVAAASCAPPPAPPARQRATAPEAAGARLLEGRVERVADGDTLRVAGVSVRLQGVAAPELAHPGLGIAEEPGGREAAAFMRGLVGGEVVACRLTGERTRRREVGVCRLDGRDVGAALVAAGLARDCPRYSGGRYAALETAEGRRLLLPGYCAPRR